MRTSCKTLGRCGNSILFNSFMFAGKAVVFPPNVPAWGRKSNTKPVYCDVFCSGPTGRRNENLYHTTCQSPCKKDLIFMVWSCFWYISVFSLWWSNLLWVTLSLSTHHLLSYLCLLFSLSSFILLPPPLHFFCIISSPPLQTLLPSMLFAFSVPRPLPYFPSSIETSGSSYCLSWRRGWSGRRPVKLRPIQI